MAISLTTKKHLFKGYNVEENANLDCFIALVYVSICAILKGGYFRPSLFIPLYKCLSMMFWLALIKKNL